MEDGILEDCLKIEFLVKINKQINEIMIIITKIILKWMNVNSGIFEINWKLNLENGILKNRTLIIGICKIN